MRSYDDYTELSPQRVPPATLRALGGLDQLPFWHTVEEHPAYDAFWQGQALDKIMASAAADSPYHVAARAMGPGRHVGQRSTAYQAVEPKDTQQR